MQTPGHIIVVRKDIRRSIGKEPEDKIKVRIEEI